MAHILGSIWGPRFKEYLLGWSTAFIGCQITLYYERKRFQQEWTELSKRQHDFEALQTERHAAAVRRLAAERYSANIRELEELEKQRDRLWTWMWAAAKRRTQND